VELSSGVVVVFGGCGGISSIMRLKFFFVTVCLFQRVAMIMGLAGVKWGQRSEADGLKYTILWIPIVDE